MTIRMLASVAGYAPPDCFLRRGRGHPTWPPARRSTTAFPNPDTGGNVPGRRILAMGGIPTITRQQRHGGHQRGSITLGTALQLTHRQCWLYPPAGAIVGGLAGWYYAIMVPDDCGAGAHQPPGHHDPAAGPGRCCHAYRGNRSNPGYTGDDRG